MSSRYFCITHRIYFCAKLFSLVALISCLSSCLYTTHHFNTAKVLTPGETQVTAGLGPHRFDKQTLIKGSLNYRFGVAGQFWIFKGLDVAWHLEAPTNPGTMEFEARLALPDLGTKKSESSKAVEVLQQTIGGGWGIGMWADNSFFAEHAIGIPWAKNRFFTTTRATYVATQFFKVFQDDFEEPLRSDQKWVIQSAFGSQFKLPTWPIVPDFVIPQCIITFPEIPAGANAQGIIRKPRVQANLGLSWGF